MFNWCLLHLILLHYQLKKTPTSTTTIAPVANSHDTVLSWSSVAGSDSFFFFFTFESQQKHVQFHNNLANSIFWWISCRMIESSKTTCRKIKCFLKGKMRKAHFGIKVMKKWTSPLWNSIRGQCCIATSLFDEFAPDWPKPTLTLKERMSRVSKY